MMCNLHRMCVCVCTLCVCVCVCVCVYRSERGSKGEYVAETIPFSQIPLVESSSSIQRDAGAENRHIEPAWIKDDRTARPYPNKSHSECMRVHVCSRTRASMRKHALDASLAAWPWAVVSFLLSHIYADIRRIKIERKTSQKSLPSILARMSNPLSSLADQSSAVNRERIMTMMGLFISFLFMPVSIKGKWTWQQMKPNDSLFPRNLIFLVHRDFHLRLQLTIFSKFFFFFFSSAHLEPQRAPSNVYLFLPTHGQPRSRPCYKLEKQRAAAAAASLLANLYAFQLGGLNPPVCLCARENKAFT